MIMKKIVLLFIVGLLASNALSEIKYALYDVGTLEEFHDGRAKIIENGKYGYIDTNGKLAIPAIYDRADNFINGGAIVQKDGKYGVINTNGNVLLPFEYTRIKSDEDCPGVYLVQNDNATKDLFYNNRIVLRGVQTLTPFLDFPFIDYMNVLTGEEYSRIRTSGNFNVCISQVDTAFFDRKGNPIAKNSALVTSNGVTLFEDRNGLLGMKNINTGEIIRHGIWASTSDRSRVDDGFILVNNGEFSLVKDNGNVVLTKGMLREEGDFILGVDFSENGMIYSLYTTDGKSIVSECEELVPFEGDWFTGTDMKGVKFILNARTGKKYPGKYATISDGMIEVTPANKADGYYFIDMKTGEILPGKYKYTYPFSEGLAYVQDFNDNEYFIDKSGSIVIRCSELSEGKYFGGHRFSEGTLGVKLGYNYTYIYNPLSNNQNGYGGVNGSSLIEEWLAKGRELFDTKPVEAKEYFYRVITNDPMNADGWVNYGACVYNLGYHNEGMEATLTALDIDPNEATALKNMQIMKENEDIKHRNEEHQRQPQEDNNSFWDALSNIGNVMVQMFGGYGNSSSYYPSDQSYSGYGETSGSSRDYQSEYNRWEQRAMKNYNSLTTTGSRSRNRSGEHSGSTGRGMNGGNYVNQKRALREAQRQMRSIRQKARAAGINIPQSQWETATVSY